MTERTPAQAGTRATERTFIFGLWFDGEEACHVASMFARAQISFASNAGAGDGRFVVTEEFCFMIQRYELWFVQTEGFSLGAGLQLHLAVRTWTSRPPLVISPL